MTEDQEKYNCVECGKCCKGRLIPLTVNEALQWIERGGRVGIASEAFDQASWRLTPDEYAYHLKRSAPRKSKDSEISVICILVGDALNQCPSLMENNLCGTYQNRPLVCQIYPVEINPFIKMNKDLKICPTEAWSSGEIIYSQSQPSEKYQTLIFASRNADHSEAERKVIISELLSLSTTAWKTDGIIVQFPTQIELLNAITESKNNLHAQPKEWRVQTYTPSVKSYLLDASIHVNELEVEHLYIQL
ncbi:MULTISPECIES: YkgJ family cysteine cluster protein [unclassified Pseudomonas]|uniref:YkgJ family cysteine cluster protein n=1 Tax=unclassified Pseudomonas TaxID=196821 RepID=UPI0035C1BFDE